MTLLVQIFIAALFLMAGMMKIMTPKKKFEKKMDWAKPMSAEKLKFIGISEVLGAIGITLPIWLSILPWLSSVAAVGLLIVVFLAFLLHLQRKENKSVVFTIVIMTALVYLLMSF